MKGGVVGVYACVVLGFCANYIQENMKAEMSNYEELDP